MTPDPLPVAPSVLLEPSLLEAATARRTERMIYWLDQARLCERDGRADLVAICLGYFEEYDRGGTVDWEA